MQQQQTNMVKPQKVGGAKKGFTPLYGGSLLKGKQVGKPMKSFGAGFGGEKSTMKAKKTVSKTPSYASVQKSIKKTMGY